MAFRERIQHTRDRIVKPTDVQLVDRVLSGGIRHIVTVPCSITASVDPILTNKAKSDEIKYWKMVSEHSLGGVASGVNLATGELAGIHFQNSGAGNAEDAFISYARVYGIPLFAISTWRGNDLKDDSEPHQEIGRITDQFTKLLVRREHAHGEKSGRGILRQVDKAIEDARENSTPVILRLSPDAFKKTFPLVLPEIPERDPEDIIGRQEELRMLKGDSIRDVFKRERISREEAIREVINRHPRALVVFSNGYTAREAQDKADRLGNFYNAGYMGGGMAIGWGAAKANPDLAVVVVDGDQNSEMGKMHEIVANDYPTNLNWYILDNGFGTSVGVSESVPLPYWYYDVARVIRTIPDKPGEFSSPRVGARGVYFDFDEAEELAKRIGPLPVHYQRLRHWALQTAEENRLSAQSGLVRISPNTRSDVGTQYAS